MRLKLQQKTQTAGKKQLTGLEYSLIDVLKKIFIELFSHRVGLSLAAVFRFCW